MRIDNSFLFLFENKLEENDKDDSVCFFKRNNSDRDYFYMFNTNLYDKNNSNIDEEQIECDKQEENNMCNEASITIQHNTHDNSPKAEVTLDAIQLEENKDKNLAADLDFIEYPNVFDVDMTENINNAKSSLNEDDTQEVKKLLKKRKAFRMMRRYYKEKFEFEFGSAEYKKNLPTMSASELNSIICQFMEQEFMMLSKILSQNDYERTRDAVPWKIPPHRGRDF